MANRKRCEKKDAAGGVGCVKPEGHKGRCKVREDAEKVFREGPPPKKAKRGRRRKRTVPEITRDIEAEVSGLREDCNALVEALGTFETAAKARQTEILKSLVASRKEIRHLKDDLEGQAVAWDAEFEDGPN